MEEDVLDLDELDLYEEELLLEVDEDVGFFVGVGVLLGAGVGVLSTAGVGVLVS